MSKLRFSRIESLQSIHSKPAGKFLKWLTTHSKRATFVKVWFGRQLLYTD